MKFRLVASLLVLAALAAVAVLLEDNPTTGQSAAPSMSADDKALKSLSIN
jgi:hypothetical protein